MPTFSDHLSSGYSAPQPGSLRQGAEETPHNSCGNS